MKILSRDFTTTERILMLVLLVILLGLGYYQFIWRYTADQIQEANSARDAMEIELQAVDAKVAEYRAMQQELESIEGSGITYSRMESYNNARAEIDLLNDIFSSADNYTVTFANVTRQGDQIRRECSLSFTAKNYSTARNMIVELSRSQYRCLVNSVQYSALSGSEDGVSVSVRATFFETMVGGTADAGLPAAENG